MKKLKLILSLLFCTFSVIISAQTVPSYPTIKLTKTVLGTKSDSTLVKSSDGTVKHFPISEIKGITNLSVSATPTGVTILSSTGTPAIIPLVTTTNAGLQSPADKTKLNGIATGATANSTDAQLRDRTTHTGVQPISTVTGLQTALDSKITSNAAITAGTNTKITYDAKGLVTSGTSLVAGDIPNIAQSQVTNLINDLALKTENSAGAIQGFAITNNGNGTINVASGTAFLRATNDPYAPLVKYNIPAATNISLIDNSNNFILVDYNSGFPQLNVTNNSADINTETNSIALVVSRVGNTLDYLSLVGQNVDANAKLRTRFLNQEGIRRLNGAAIGFSNRNLTLSASVLASGLIKINAPAFNTNTPDTFTQVYNNGLTWTRTIGQTQVNNTQYNNAGVLTNLGNNDYRTDYIYLLPNNPSKLYLVLGTASYTSLTAARSAPQPAYLPTELQVLGVQVGRSIIQRLGTSIAEVSSPFETVFSGSSVPEHNALAGIQGGAANDYQHLTTTQLNDIAYRSGTVFTGITESITPTTANSVVTKSYADGLVVGLLDDRGSYNASTNLFPTTGGSGVSGAILKGDLWYISVAGTLAGKAVNVGDSFRALSDAPAQIAGNWSVLSSNLGYVPENSANKQNSLNIDATNLKYPTVTAVNTGLSAKANTSDVVTLATAQTITAQKIFSAPQIIFEGSVAATPATSVAAFTASNSTSGNTFASFGSSTGNGYYAYNTTTGNGFVSNIDTGGTGGFSFIGKNQGLNTFTVNKIGDVIATTYIKSGGTATQGLLANGGTFNNPISGTGVAGNVPRFSAISTLENSIISAGNTSAQINGDLILTKTDGAKQLFQDGVTPFASLASSFNTQSSGSTIKTDFNAYVYGNNPFAVWTNGVKRINVLGNGNIGLGVDPNAKLDVNGDIHSRGVVLSDTFGGYSSANVKITTNTSGTASLIFNTQTIDRMIIDSGGNVLVGTTTSNGVDKLQVNGTISTTGINSPYLGQTPLEVFNAAPLSSSSTTSGNNESLISSGFYILETFRYTTNDWGMQRITYMNSGVKNKMYVRTMESGTMSAWVEK